MGDMRLQINIDTALGPQGMKDASRALRELAVEVDNVKPAAGRATEGMSGFVAKQEVSKREIKIFTGELLRSLGVMEGAGAAGRVAADGFALMGSAAHAANFALAASGLAIVLLVPKLLEWAGAADKVAEENKKVIESIAGQDEHLASLIEKVPELAKRYREWAAAVHQVALDQEALKIQQLFEEAEKLQSTIGHMTGWWKLLATTLVNANQGMALYNEMQKEATEGAEQNKHAIAALMEEIYARSAALTRGKTLQEEDTKATNDSTQSHKDHTQALKAEIDELDRLAQMDKEAVEIQMKQVQDKKDADAAQELDAKHEIEKGQKRLEMQDAETRKRSEAAFKEAKQAKDHQRQEREKAAATKMMYADMAASAVAATAVFVGLFTKNKAINIAAALANTYAAAVGALNQPPYPPWTIPFAALAIAEGLRNVQEIRKSGFDNPRSDVLAERRGERWAEDLLTLVDRGMYRRLDQSMTPLPAVSQVQNTRNLNVQHLNVPGFYGPNKVEMLKGLARDLEYLQNFERRGTMGD